MIWRAFLGAVSRRAVLCVPALFLATLALSCASSEPKSPAPAIGMSGEKSALQGLVGRWDGTFTNSQNGRTGTIVFEIFSDKEAHGDILMIPPGSKEPLHPAAPPSAEETLRTMPRVLEINFFQAEAGELTGTVGPFEDLDCGCAGRTSFRGAIRGDSIEGTFATEYLDADFKPDAARPGTGGTWRVARTKKS